MEDQGHQPHLTARNQTEGLGDCPQPTARDPTADQGDQPQPTSARLRPTYISMPYVKGTSENIGRNLALHQIRLGCSSKPTVWDKLVRAKDGVPKDLRKG